MAAVATKPVTAVVATPSMLAAMAEISVELYRATLVLYVVSEMPLMICRIGGRIVNW